jgi:outer membrane protein assembly factor BamB
MKIKTSLALAGVMALAGISNRAAVDGWLSWRGPNQNGFSAEKGLPNTVDPSKPLWTANFPGQSTPVIANGKLYIMGYLGDGPDLQEGVTCFDADTGKQLWKSLYNDFLSDTIYLRYATSSPGIDPETGNVYMLGTQGIMAAFSADGKPLWNHSMMERYGRLTFPNSRSSSPVVDGDLVISHSITANWGAHGAAGDRFYAFDKKSGELVWASAPGDRPKDNSFSLPYFTILDGRRVLIAPTGDGSIVCVNARTGDPIWRVPLAKAGINATAVVHNNDKVIAIYGTPYEPGQMVALKIPHVYPTNILAGPVVVDREQVELWAAEISTSTSSPILVGDRVFVVTEKGSLCDVDANTGKILWRLQIGIEQRNSCPLFADGKLYVPIRNDVAEDSDKSKTAKPAGEDEGGGMATKGGFYIIKPTDEKGEQLAHVSLDGVCYGSPTAYNGKVYIQTTRKLYCFGKAGNNPGVVKVTPEKWPAPGPAKQLQIIPSEVVLHPGDVQSFRVRTLDANGFTVEELKDVKAVKWESFIPPTARVKSSLKGSFNAEGKLVADKDVVASAGAFKATYNGATGFIRGRVLPGLPIKEDFESFQLTDTTTNAFEPPTKFAYPPLPWIGARFKTEVREKDGNKDLTKTIDNKFFQRGTIFFGEPDMKNYTIQADVLSEGDRRKMSEVGIINQRYLIVLKGNEKKLEINSNQERLRVPAKEEPPNFQWVANTWYTMKARVDLKPDGSGVVRAKAWKRGDPEPDKWTLEVPHKTAHQTGCPGLFMFAPNDQRVHIDNILVTPNN